MINPNSNTMQAIAMLEGHHRFLNRNTGLTIDPRTDLFVLNPDGVLSNNRHFIASTQMEYQPNGDATSEGQSLQIIGHCYAYLATGNPAYLQAAKWTFDAYINHFYAGDPIPSTASRWIANWIINGKEPCLANWPINPVDPTNGGYKGVPVRFTDGVGYIPHGTPFWGEYLDVVGSAYRGHLSYGSILATPRAIVETVDWDVVYENHRITQMPDNPYDQLAWVDWAAYLNEITGYTVDWSLNGELHSIHTMVAWTGDEIDVEQGEPIASDLPPSEIGRIVLNDTSINGVYLLGYAVRLPEEHGGYRFERNEVWHNRPIHTPLLGGSDQRGNASDAELWFADACHLLYRITGESKYKQALDSVLFTLTEYTLIDSEDMFFRQATDATTPFTDGISYDWIYPSEVNYVTSRDEAGYIHSIIDASAQWAIEQQAVSFRVNTNAKISTTFAGIGDSDAPVNAIVEVEITENKSDISGTLWQMSYPPSSSLTPIQYDIPITQLLRVSDDQGQPYILADTRSCTEYGGVTYLAKYESGILGQYTGSVVEALFPDDDGGFVIGNWLYDNGTRPLTGITYRADALYFIRTTDTDGWNWWWPVPNTNNEWVYLALRKEDAILSGYQPNANGRPLPDSPVYEEIEQVSILLDEPATNSTFAYFCLNDLPPQFNQDDGFIQTYTLTLACSESFTVKVGNCTVIDQRDDQLNYCPGVIPFSNIYSQGSYQFAHWRGLPYPGYQYPIVFMLDDTGIKTRQLNNMVQFMYDAQQAYYQNIGELGPVAPAYIWDRPDATVYGPANTWTMYHWGDGRAWSGYQPRAFFGGCLAWQYLSENNLAVPAELMTYCERWVTWLIDFFRTHDGMAPTDFYPDQVAQATEFNGHMAGLWLSGLCSAYMAGCRINGIETAIEQSFTEIASHYTIMAGMIDHPFNGTWPSWISGNTQLPDGSWYVEGGFYGFHSGELLRGISSYILYQRGLPFLANAMT